MSGSAFTRDAPTTSGGSPHAWLDPHLYCNALEPLLRLAARDTVSFGDMDGDPAKPQVRQCRSLSSSHSLPTCDLVASPRSVGDHRCGSTRPASPSLRVAGAQSIGHDLAGRACSHLGPSAQAGGNTAEGEHMPDTVPRLTWRVLALVLYSAGNSWPVALM